MPGRREIEIGQVADRQPAIERRAPEQPDRGGAERGRRAEVSRHAAPGERAESERALRGDEVDRGAAGADPIGKRTLRRHAEGIEPAHPAGAREEQDRAHGEEIGREGEEHRGAGGAEARGGEHLVEGKACPDFREHEKRGENRAATVATHERAEFRAAPMPVPHEHGQQCEGRHRGKNVQGRAPARPSWLARGSCNAAPPSSRRASAPAPPCAARMSLRRSTRSASAPAGRARRKSGRLDIVCMSEIMSGDGVSVAIVQIAAVSFIVVPIFEMTLAIQSARNSGRRSGDGAGAELSGMSCAGFSQPRVPC